MRPQRWRKNLYQESIKRAAGTGTWEGNMLQQLPLMEMGLRSEWEGDPMVTSAKWLYRTFKSPTAKSWGYKSSS